MAMAIPFPQDIIIFAHISRTPPSFIAACFMHSPPSANKKVQTSSALGYYVRRDRSDQLHKKREAGPLLFEFERIVQT
jgi:hypothetical protein